MAYNSNNYSGSTYGGNEYWRDVDTRPKSQPCRHCTRNVEYGKRCVCVASKPLLIFPRDGSAARLFVFRP